MFSECIFNDRPTDGSAGLKRLISSIISVIHTVVYVPEMNMAQFGNRASISLIWIQKMFSKHHLMCLQAKTNSKLKDGTRMTAREVTLSVILNNDYWL